jgi:hypothetical protein
MVGFSCFGGDGCYIQARDAGCYLGGCCVPAAVAGSTRPHHGDDAVQVIFCGECRQAGRQAGRQVVQLGVQLAACVEIHNDRQEDEEFDDAGLVPLARREDLGGDESIEQVGEEIDSTGHSKNARQERPDQGRVDFQPRRVVLGP